MDRLQKKCLIGSGCMHVFLALLLLVGSAFFIQPEKRPDALPQVRIIPSILIDKAMAGGGGNPNVAKTDDQQKGDTTVPQPKPAEIKPVVQQPTPKPKERVVEPPKPKPQKPDPPKEVATKPQTEKPKETALNLKPTTRSEMQKKTPKDTAAEADAKRRTELAQKVAKELGGVQQSLVAGFKGGTRMEVWGPGGEAYAGYEAFVQAVYDNAWETSHLIDYDGAVRVTVTIRRTGDVISAYITKGCGTAVVDKSVQRALDRVKFVAPFPAGAKDEQRTFNITFDLKAKRLIG